jgi:hypothetical protein
LLTRPVLGNWPGKFKQDVPFVPDSVEAEVDPFIEVEGSR